MAPFTNNLRIAITTISVDTQPLKDNVHAYIQKCNNLTNNCYNTGNRNSHNDSHLTDGSTPRTQRIKNLEYIENDIKNIPINTPTNILVNVKGRIVEIYINHKLSKIHQLSGFPDFSFAPQSSQITSVTNIDSDNIRLVIGDNTVSDNGSVIPGFTIDDMLSVGDSVYYAPYGKHHWISTLHSTIGDITGWACAVDSSDNIYTIGYIYEDSTLGSIVLTKHSSSGSLIWQRALSGAYKEYGYGIAVDTLNNVFVVSSTSLLTTLEFSSLVL